ncbi:hypothetical protein KEM54_001699, partial [Ascosphaera aggregata]
MIDHGVNLNLTPEEKRLYYRLFQIADKTNLGVITGEVAVSFFEKTGLPSDTLGQIWQMADTENRGLLTPTAFSIVMRLIGHAQAGRAPTEELALQPGPLPIFTGLEDANPAAPLVSASSKPAAPVPSQQPQPAAAAPSAAAGPSPSGLPGPATTSRVPPLNQDEMIKFITLFDRSDPQNGLIPGDQAKQIFERSRLPNETLGQIWNLVDTQSRGCLDQAEFIIAMHLLTAARSRVMVSVPPVLPPGLYETAARFTAGHVPGAAAQHQAARTGSAAGLRPPTGTAAQPTRVQSPISRTFGSVNALSPQTTGQSLPLRGSISSTTAANGPEWLVTPVYKQQFDTIFANIDRTNSGYISGEQAVDFFSQASLGEEVLAQIWDLADIDSDGQLNRDEFAVAMFLIRQQRAGKEPLPMTLPPALVPPAMRQVAAPAAASAAAPAPAPVPAPAPQATKSAAEDLFGLDVFSQPAPGAATSGAQPPAAAVQVPQGTGGSSNVFTASPNTPASRGTGTHQPAVSSTTTPSGPTAGVSPGVPSGFKPFVPTSSFGQSLAPQYTGQSTRAGPTAVPASAPAPVSAPAPTSAPAPAQAPGDLGADDLLGDANPEESKKLTVETTELANLSNQIGTLSREMKNVQEKRVAAEHELTQTSSQKRDFETRLAQARTMYQKEVDDFKALEELLKNSRADTAKKQAEYALLEGQRADLQTQLNSVSAALEGDLADNASLKEKIKAVNAAIATLKSQLEKVKSEARQQKGLVAINKKQLAALEAEKDKLNAEVDSANKELDEVQKEFKEQTHLLSERSTPSPAVGASGTPLSAASGMNPFFRRPTNPEREISQSPAAGAPPSAPGPAEEIPQLPSTMPKDKESLFDDVFGPMPSKPTTPTPQPAPATSFHSASGSNIVPASPVPGAQSPQPSSSAPAASTRAISPLPSLQPSITGQEAAPADQGGATNTSCFSPSPPVRTNTDFIARDLPGSFPDMAPSAAVPAEITAPHAEAAPVEEKNGTKPEEAASAKTPGEEVEETTAAAEQQNEGDVHESKVLFTSSAAHTQPLSGTSASNFPTIEQFENDDEESSSDEEGPELIAGYKPELHGEESEPTFHQNDGPIEFPSAAAHTFRTVSGADTAT